MIQIIDPDKMTKEELNHLGEEVEKLDFSDTQPLNAAERRQVARAARKGRPRIGKGARRINVTVEQSLLGKADSYAKKHGLTRAALVAEGLKRILAA